MAVILILAGFGLLLGGADLLVRGGSGLARAVGLSPLVIGLTVVAFGTSAPEFAVSLKAALSGNAGIAVGNVVGSNSFNILLILGVSALITPLAVSVQLVRLDVPVMITASAVAWVVSLDGVINRAEGLVMVAIILGYTGLLVHLGTRPRNQIQEHQGHLSKTETGGKGRGILKSVITALGGLVLLVLGARWLVTGAVSLAEMFGMSDLLIGLTLVAAGTSLPEAATSVVASLRGERDIAVGNVVGSNIFNIFAVLGGTAAVSGRVDVAPAALHFDIPVMIATAVICMPVFFTGFRISRWEGALFLVYYGAYLAYQFLAASSVGSLPFFNWAMVWFVLPVTAAGILLSVYYAIRNRR